LVFFMPSARAARFMRAANSDTLPETASATTTATSLADFVVSARMASSTLIDVPAFRPSLEGACRAAFADTERRLDRLKRFASRSSNRT
jgi:hypothetical protein